MLGFYILDCETLDEALEAARALAKANPGGAYEVRPVGLFVPGAGQEASEGTYTDARDRL